jgi:hypothetical protein
MAKLTGLYRFDSPSNGSFVWQVTVQRKGTRFNKFFSDGRYGGRQGTFSAEKLYRQAVLSSYDAYTRKERCLKLKRDNQTGYPGVCRLDRESVPGALNADGIGLPHGLRSKASRQKARNFHTTLWRARSV